MANAATPQEAAKIYPASYWTAMIQPPPSSDLPPRFKSQDEWLATLRNGCNHCHALGMPQTRIYTTAKDWDAMFLRAQSMHRELDAMGKSSAVGIDALEGATRWIVDTFPANPNAVAAVAVPYLKLFGFTAGAWMMAQAAMVALARRKEVGADTVFYDAKLATARFYCEHILPQAVALAQSVREGAKSVLALNPDEF